MRKKTLSKEFERSLVDISAGVLSSSEFEKLITLFETEIRQVYFTASSEANLIRIIQGMYDKVFFIKECIKYPHYVEILTSISANSNYLTDILVINPEYFYWVVNPSILNSKISEIEFRKEVKTTLSLYNAFNSKVHALKSLKRKELLKIGLRDIYLKTPLEEITGELSILASHLTSEMFTICYNEINKKYNILNPSGTYCLVALGKLGGGELNYSSDIDLIIFYDKERKTRGKKYFSEILTETAQLFLQSSAKITGGFLYRIDFRLRPDGRNSPLCRSLYDYLNYYESRGEDWERQMLIKSDFVTGSKTLYKKFINYLTTFIYPSTFSTSPQKQILKMKESIERSIDYETDIKLIHGGIRDIEFSVQALQLLNGGKNKSIRSGNTLAAIDALKQATLLSSYEAKTFTDAYIFYRQIEHYLQLMNNRQTHVIPEKGELLESISFYLQFKNSDSFRIHLSSIRKKVRVIYNAILTEEDNERKTGVSLAEIAFEDPNRAKNDFQFLRDGRGIVGNRSFDSKSIESFGKIEQKIYSHLKESVFPDKILSNFVRIVRQAEFPSLWYRELADNTFFELFTNVCEFSQFSIDLYAEDKELREFCLSRKVFMKIPMNELMEYEIKKILLYLSVQVTVKLIEPVAASNLLSNLLHKKIRMVLKEEANKEDWKNDYFVAVLGSLGSSTITFYSDLDIIIILRNSQKYPDIEKEFQKILSQLRLTFKPFTIDCRLRPEGKSSQLVWDIENSKKYFQMRARIWEYQALTKISFAAGNKRLFNSFIKEVVSSLSRIESNKIKKELIEMHKKTSSRRINASFEMFDFKKSRGGLYDIELIVQYLILCNRDLFSKLIGETFIDQIKSTANAGLKNSQVKLLNNAFNFIKSIELLNQIMFGGSSSKILFNEKKINAFCKIMNYDNSEEFNIAMRTHLTNVRNIFSQLFK